VFLLAVCFLFSPLGLIAKDTVSGTAIMSLSDPLAYAFYAVMWIGAATALAGLFLPFKGLKGPLVERSGLLLLAAVWFGYGGMALATSGLKALGFAFVVLGFAAANTYRALRQIPAEIKVIAAAAAVTNTLDELAGEET
jgi:hypothetical protein